MFVNERRRMRGKERMMILHEFDTQGVVVYWSSCNMTMLSYILFYRRSLSEFGHYLEALRNCIVITRKAAMNTLLIQKTIYALHSRFSMVCDNRVMRDLTAHIHGLSQSNPLAVRTKTSLASRRRRSTPSIFSPSVVGRIRLAYRRGARRITQLWNGLLGSH
jgi:hypothetical protein